MAFTDDCDLYFAVTEGGVNRIARHIMRQRPSLFNYATADIAGDREQWCRIPAFAKDVAIFGNPVFTVLPYLPVIGADSPPVGLGFCVQVTEVEVDFHPSNVFGLPPEIELKDQQLALHLRLCGGIGCPDPEQLDEIPVIRHGPDGYFGKDLPEDAPRDRPPLVPVPGRIRCFCLDVFVAAHVVHEDVDGVDSLVGKVDAVEIVDVEPDALQWTMECYIRTAVSLFLRQHLAIPMETLFLDIPLFGMGTISLFPTPTPPVAHNPAVEDDQLKAFITMTV